MKGHSSVLSVYALLFLLFLYGPVLLMPVFSLNDNIFATFPLKAFTLRHYASLGSSPSMIGALTNSLMVGAGVSILSTVLGLLAAIALTRYRLPGSPSLVGMIMLPLVVPSIILGVAPARNLAPHPRRRTDLVDRRGRPFAYLRAILHAGAHVAP